MVSQDSALRTPTSAVGDDTIWGLRNITLTDSSPMCHVPWRYKTKEQTHKSPSSLPYTTLSWPCLN